MFLGEYNHSIDAKGRLIVPAKFRDELGEKFTVTKGIDKCLYIYPQKEWDEFVEKLESLPMGKSNLRGMVRAFLSSATETEIDKQGRILINASHRKYADIDKDVVLAGVGKKIEIWSKDSWEESAILSPEQMEEIAEQMYDFGIDF